MKNARPGCFVQVLRSRDYQFLNFLRYTMKDEALVKFVEDANTRSEIWEGINCTMVEISWPLCTLTVIRGVFAGRIFSVAFVAVRCIDQKRSVGNTGEHSVADFDDVGIKRKPWINFARWMR